MNQDVWTPEDADQLRTLRTGGDIDLAQLARTFALSEAQILELEGQGDGHFYNPGIKYRTGRRLLNRFGILTVAERRDLPPEAEKTAARSATDDDFSISEADREALGLVRPPAKPQHQPLPLHWPRVIGLGAVVLAVAGGLGWWALSDAEGTPMEAPVALAPDAVTAPTTPATEAVASESAAPASVPLADGQVALAAPGGAAAVAPAQVDMAAAQPSPAPVEPIEEAPSKVRVAPVAVACRDQVPEGDVQRFVPSSPLKGSHYVYLTARSGARVCVRDASGRVTEVKLTRGGQRSVTGRAPFTVYGTDLAQVRVFFRGRPVRVQPSTQQLVLGE